MFIERLAEYLEGQDAGTIGLDLFVHKLPADVKIGVLLKEPIGGTPYDPEMPGYYKIRFEVIVRHFEHEAGIAMANSVWDALFVRRAVTWEDVKVNYVRPLIRPVVFPLSEADQIEYAILVEACFIF